MSTYNSLTRVCCVVVKSSRFERLRLSTNPSIAYVNLTSIKVDCYKASFCVVYVYSSNGLLCGLTLWKRCFLCGRNNSFVEKLSIVNAGKRNSILKSGSLWFYGMVSFCLEYRRDLTLIHFMEMLTKIL